MARRNNLEEPPDCFGVAASPHDESVWFWDERPFALFDRRLPSGFPTEVMTVRGLAARTGRHRDAITRALRAGHLLQVGHDARGRILVRVNADDVERWRAPILADLLAKARADDPGFPCAESGWRTAADVAHALGTSWRTARDWLARIRAPILEWGADTPFGIERRYFLPELHRARSRGVVRRYAVPEAARRE